MQTIFEFIQLKTIFKAKWVQLLTMETSKPCKLHGFAVLIVVFVQYFSFAGSHCIFVKRFPLKSPKLNELTKISKGQAKLYSTKTKMFLQIYVNFLTS